MTTHGMEADTLKKPIPKELLGAFKQGHRPTAREFIDDELAQKLLRLAMDGSAQALKLLKYISKFNNEYYKGVFTGTKKDLIQGKKRRRERWRASNQRRSDVLNNMLRDESDRILVESPEDALIELLDMKRDMEKSSKQ